MHADTKPLILIVDQRLSTLASLDSLLSREGHRVATCSSSREALRAVAWQRLDLVIVGNCDTDSGAAALVSKIKFLSPETSVLVLVETDGDSMIPGAITAGADGLLRRSYSESQVIQRVDRLLYAIPAKER